MTDIHEAQVRQTVLAMTAAIDAGGLDIVDRFFAPRTRLDYTSLWGGDPVELSPDEIQAAWGQIVPGFEATWHELSSIVIELSDPATASLTCAVDARHWLGQDVWRLQGEYRFTLLRTDRWRIATMAFHLAREIGARDLVDQARARAAA